MPGRWKKDKDQEKDDDGEEQGEKEMLVGPVPR